MLLLCHCNAPNGLYCQAASPENGGILDALSVWNSFTGEKLRPEDIPTVSNLKDAPADGLYLIRRTDVVRAMLEGNDMALTILEEITGVKE